MKHLNSPSVKATDMVPELCAIFLCNIITFLKSNENMKNLNSSSVKVSDMAPEVYAISVSEDYSSHFILCNSGVNLLYTCLKSNTIIVN